MVIRKIRILNSHLKLVKGNFATLKYYYLKLLTRKFILNFELVKSKWQLVK